jgi:hypothetical protein
MSLEIKKISQITLGKFGPMVFWLAYLVVKLVPLLSNMEKLPPQL